MQKPPSETPHSSQLRSGVLGHPQMTANPRHLGEDAFQPAQKLANIQKLSRPSLSYWADAWRRLKKNRQALSAMFLLLGLVLLTLLGPTLYRVDPSVQRLTRINETPNLGRSILVLDELQPYNEVIDTNFPETPPAGQTINIVAPAGLELMEPPSLQGVRLKWKPVAGSIGYSIYRSNGDQPKDMNTLGVPIGEVMGANHISYEDTFGLIPGKYWYSVVPKAGHEEDAQVFATINLELKSSINLTDAQAIIPEAKIGQTIRLPAAPLGTDELGRDLLARLIAGGQISLFIGFLAAICSTLIGVLIGGASGFAGGKTDLLIMRFTELVQAFPFLLGVILFKVALFGGKPGESGITAMLFSIVVLGWTGAARLTRGQILQMREAEFVQATRLLGGRSFYLLVRHLIPNTLGVILVSLTFSIPSAIFTEAFLSFIGMGVVPPTPSWGSMCNDGIKNFLTYSHEFLYPSLMICLTVLGFNLFGDGLRDALDPKLRGGK